MKPGIYAISEAEYQKDVADVPSLSQSIAKVLIGQSPLHAWNKHPKLNPNFEREDKEIFDLGTVAHALMLQGLNVAVVLEFDDWRKDAAREKRDECRKAGLIPILKKHWERVQAMVLLGRQQIEQHKEGSDIFSFDAGRSEQTLIWEDDHGVICRARLDWLRTDYKRIADYKGTGTSVNPESIAKYALSQGWDLQAAFYIRGVKKLTGIDAEFLFAAQEDYLPHALAIFGMGPDFLWSGQSKVQIAIDKFAECLDSGKWPGYPDRVCYPILPAWEESRLLVKELQ